MSKNPFADLSTEKLIKRRDLLKGVLIAFAIMWLLLIAVATYFYITKSTLKMFIPMAILPMTLLPSFIQLTILNKELKTR
mgnify:FL=1